MKTSFHFHVDGTFYVLDEPMQYFSPRYKKCATAPAGMKSDGASGPAEDIVSEGWWIHDHLCSTHKWDDGTPCTNLQRSFVLHDILLKEGRWIRAKTWFVATLIYGWTRRKHNDTIDPLNGGAILSMA